MESGDICVVTNVSDLTATWIAKLLLEQKYIVRGTLPLTEAHRVDKLKEILPELIISVFDPEINQQAWVETLSDAKWVFHVALPYGIKSTSAIKITRLVLQTAFSKSNSTIQVQKVVMTSSDDAIIHGHSSRKLIFDEDDWSRIKNSTPDYIKAATLSEQAAWSLYVDENPNNVGFSTINPAAIVGPAVAPWHKTQLRLISDIASGRNVVCPHKAIHLVEVQDLAKMHIAVMSKRSATGFRHLAYSLKTSVYAISKMIQQDYSECGFNSSLFNISNLMTGLIRSIVHIDTGYTLTLERKPSQDNRYQSKHSSTYTYEIKTLYRFVRSSMDSLLITGVLKAKHPIARLGLGTPKITPV